MRTIPFLSSLLLTVSVPALSIASVPNSLLPMAAWHVAPITANGPNTSAYCALASHYSNDAPIVTITRNTNGKSSIAFDFQNAAFDNQSKYGVTLKAGLHKKTFAARAVSSTQIVVQLGDDDALYQAWHNGHNLTVSLDGTPGLYHLAANRTAAKEFDACLTSLTPQVPVQAVIAENLPTPSLPPSLPAPIHKKAVEPVAAAPVIAKVTPVSPAPIVAAPLELTAIKPVPQAPTSTQIDGPIETVSILWDNPTPAYLPKEALPLIGNDGLFGNIEKNAETSDIAWQHKPIDTTAAEAAATSLLIIEGPSPIAPPVQAPVVSQEESELKSTLAKARQQAAHQKVIQTTEDVVPSIPATRSQIAPSVEAEPLTEAMPSLPVPAKAVARIEEARVPLLPVSAPASVEPSNIENLIYDSPELAAHYRATTSQAHTDTVDAPIYVTDRAVQDIPAIPTAPSVAAAPVAEPTAPTASPIADVVVTPVVQKASPYKPVPPLQDVPNPVLQKPVPQPAPAPASRPLIETQDQQPPSYNPPVMPAPKPILSVSAEPVTRASTSASSQYLNTVTPSVGTTGTRSMQNVTTQHAKAFLPPPSTATGNWTVRKLQGDNQKDNFCLIENSFDNDLMLMIGQRADGYSTLGLNYGVNMLQGNRSYAINVQIDNHFEEDFTGYAENPQMLVVQMGKKQSLFHALQQAQAMRVAMPGVASSFKMHDLSDALDELSNCLTTIGGQSISAAPPMAAALPIGTEAAQAVPIPPVAVSDTTLAPTTSSWAAQIRRMMEDAGFNPQAINQDNTDMVVTHASMTGRATATPQTDIMEAAVTAIDNAEAACAGAFSTEIGIPETLNSTTLQQMESTCLIGNDAHVSAWVVENQPGDTTSTVWNMTAPKAQSIQAFDARRKIVKAIETRIR